LREAYRLNKVGLVNLVKEKNVRIKLIFGLSETGADSFKQLSFSEINRDMGLMIVKISEFL